MRVISVMILVSLLSACSAPWHAEKPVPAAETRQQTCQPGSNPSQNDAVISLNLNSIDPVTRRSLL